jgi:amino-acid N-acetyltransferase
MSEARRAAPLSALEPARREDRASIQRLVAGSGLPLQGLVEHLGSALVARTDGSVVGCVALELYGEDALLRSLAVAHECRGRGLGLRLAEAAVELARRRGARRLWLLTTTAEGFFPRLGFGRVDREELPTSLGASAELHGACPASAVAMRLDVRGAAREV